MRKMIAEISRHGNSRVGWIQVTDTETGMRASLTLVESDVQQLQDLFTTKSIKTDRGSVTIEY